MCKPMSKPPSKTSRAISWVNGVLFPLHPSIAVVAMAYWMPSWFYMNRGFTVWFHLGSVLQLLTQSKFLTKVLSLSGISICLGWYASQFFEVLYHGRFFHALYKNMPAALVEQIVDQETGAVDFESTHSQVAMLICHFLDFLGHPLLAYYFWNKSRKDCERSNGSAIEWPAILSSYCFSRCWSIVHNYHNFGKFGLFYFGLDVYVLDSVDAFYPSYIVESLFYLSLVAWKLNQSTTKEKQI